MTSRSSVLPSCRAADFQHQPAPAARPAPKRIFPRAGHISGFPITDSIIVILCLSITVFILCKQDFSPCSRNINNFLSGRFMITTAVPAALCCLPASPGTRPRPRFMVSRNAASTSLLAWHIHFFEKDPCMQMSICRRVPGSVHFQHSGDWQDSVYTHL